MAYQFPNGVNLKVFKNFGDPWRIACQGYASHVSTVPRMSSNMLHPIRDVEGTLRVYVEDASKVFQNFAPSVHHMSSKFFTLDIASRHRKSSSRVPPILRVCQVPSKILAPWLYNRSQIITSMLSVVYVLLSNPLSPVSSWQNEGASDFWRCLEYHQKS